MVIFHYRTSLMNGQLMVSAAPFKLIPLSLCSYQQCTRSIVEKRHSSAYFIFIKTLLYTGMKKLSSYILDFNINLNQSKWMQLGVQLASQLATQLRIHHRCAIPQSSASSRLSSKKLFSEFVNCNSWFDTIISAVCLCLFTKLRRDFTTFPGYLTTIEPRPVFLFVAQLTLPPHVKNKP